MSCLCYSSQQWFRCQLLQEGSGLWILGGGRWRQTLSWSAPSTLGHSEHTWKQNLRAAEELVTEEHQQLRVTSKICALGKPGEQSRALPMVLSPCWFVLWTSLSHTCWTLSHPPNGPLCLLQIPVHLSSLPLYRVPNLPALAQGQLSYSLCCQNLC